MFGSRSSSGGAEGMEGREERDGRAEIEKLREEQLRKRKARLSYKVETLTLEAQQKEWALRKSVAGQ